jgi:peroxiredoxin family protein
VFIRRKFTQKEQQTAINIKIKFLKQNTTIIQKLINKNTKKPTQNQEIANNKTSQDCQISACRTSTTSITH